MAEKKTAPVTTVKSEVDTMVDALVEKAQVALHKFLELDQEQVDHIVHEMALAGLDKHQELARMAVEETGRGVYEDKVIKNMFATEYIWHDIKNEKKAASVWKIPFMNTAVCACWGWAVPSAISRDPFSTPSSRWSGAAGVCGWLCGGTAGSTSC